MTRDILLLNGFTEPDDIVTTATSTLEAGGHNVEVWNLAEMGFRPFMTTEERRAYHTDDNLLDPQTQEAAKVMHRIDGFVVCSPHTAFAVSPLIKGFLDRVLIPGVAFTFDEAGKLVPRLRHITRVGLAVRTPHDDATIRKHRDAAHRFIMRTVRLNSAWNARNTHVRVRPGETTAGVAKAFASW